MRMLCCDICCRYSLEKLDLRDNAVEYLCELWVIAGCVHLRELTLSHGSHTNPVCWAKSYQTTILSAVPHLRSLDGKLLDKKDDAIMDFEAVSVPPLPVWALQRCYPPQQNCPELPRFCSHLPTAPKVSICKSSTCSSTTLSQSSSSCHASK